MGLAVSSRVRQGRSRDETCTLAVYPTHAQGQRIHLRYQTRRVKKQHREASQECRLRRRIDSIPIEFSTKMDRIKEFVPDRTGPESRLGYDESVGQWQCKCNTKWQ